VRTATRAARQKLAKANLGDPVSVWHEDHWRTDIGAVSVIRVKGDSAIGVGPVILIRRDRLIDIIAGKPQPLPTSSKIDELGRLFITISAENGSWTWRVRPGESDLPYDIDVAVWCD
jgi:hypothetical protein